MTTTQEARTLDREAIGAIDVADQLTDVLAIPEHLRDALWKVESAGLQPWDSRAGLVVAGMGCAAVGGMMARAAMTDHASRPILTARAYGLPPWTTPDTTVLCSSYSGRTEETLACYDAAGALGATRVVAASGGPLAELARQDGVPVIPVAGGLSSRTAVAYFTVAALEVAGLCGAGPRMASDVDVAADHLEQLVLEWGPEAPEDSLAKTLARGLLGTVPLIYGAGLTTPLAYRWKSQLNENAKVHAFWHELPEASHNELVGWEGAASQGRFSAVFVEDSDTHPRIRERVDATEALIRDAGGTTFRVTTVGTTPFERVFSLVLLGDLVSLYLAVLRGVDPTPLTAVERLRSRLS